MTRRRPARPARATRAAVVALAAVVGLGACTGGKPSAKAVAEDIVESVPDLTDAERACLRAKLDDYTTDELEALGAANENVDWDAADPVASTTEEFQAFVTDLESCTTG